jgi:tryptophan synthase alpha subunit
MTDVQVTYACDRAPGMVVLYAGDTARIVTPGSDDTILLQRKPAKSGFWYQSPTHSIRGKRRQVTYTVGRMVPMMCTAP